MQTSEKSHVVTVARAARRSRDPDHDALLKNAKAASGGAERSRNSSDLAAGSESVVRVFLKSAQAAKARLQTIEKHTVS